MLRLCHFLEIRHRDVICALIALSTKTELTVDRSLSTHATWSCVFKDYLLQWKKPIRILSSWGVNVYGYDFKWRDVKKSESQNGIGGCFCVQISQMSDSDQSLYGYSYINTIAFVSPHIHCIWMILDNNVKSEITTSLS